MDTLCTFSSKETTSKKEDSKLGAEKWWSGDDQKDAWGKSTETRADEYVSNKGDGGNHCHLWVNKEEGESGVVHRGACKVCDDERTGTGGSSTGILDGIMNGIGKLFEM